MEYIKGKTLQTGVTASGLDGVLEQSAERTALGELKEYKDRDGKAVSVYANDKGREEISFEALIETSVDDFEVGDETIIMGVPGVVTAYKKIEQNDDVKKVQMTVRTYPDIPA